MAFTSTREHPMFEFIKTQVSQNKNAWLVEFLNNNPEFNIAVLYDIYSEFSNDFIEVDNDAYFTLSCHVLRAKKKQHVHPNIDIIFQTAALHQDDDLVLRLLQHYPVSNVRVKEAHRTYAMRGDETMTLAIFNYIELSMDKEDLFTHTQEVLYSAMRTFKHKLTYVICNKLVKLKDCANYDISYVILNTSACGMLDLAEELLLSHLQTINTSILTSALSVAYEESNEYSRFQSNFAYLAMPFIDELPLFSEMQLQLLFPDIDTKIKALTPDTPEKDILNLLFIQLEQNKALTPLEMLHRAEKWLQPYYLRFFPL